MYFINVKRGGRVCHLGVIKCKKYQEKVLISVGRNWYLVDIRLQELNIEKKKWLKKIIQVDDQFGKYETV